MSVEKKLGLINENLDRVSSETPLFVTKAITFAGATPNAIGDFDGTGNPTTLYTVTGEVAVKVFCYCSTDLIDAGSAGTVEVGITGSTASIIAQTLSNNIDSGEVWLDGTPAVAPTMPTTYKILVGGSDVILTCATDNTNSGVLEIFCAWYPLSSNGNVVAA